MAQTVHVGPSSWIGAVSARWSRSAGIWAATGVLFAISAIAEPHSLGQSSLAGMWPFAAVLILASVGQTLVIQQRGIDLSVPGFISLAAIIVSHNPGGDSAKLLPAIGLAYGISILGGLANGLMVTRIGIPPIVQTLGMNAVFFGIDLWISNGTPTQTTSALQNFANGTIIGIPDPLVIAALLTVVVALVIKTTAAGRRFEACGVSARAGRAAGLRGDRYQMAAYLGAALLYCTAGVMAGGIVSQPGAFDGNSYLLPSVAAVVLGGTSLLGGVGSVMASAVGALFLSQLQQLILITGATAAVQNLVDAGVLAAGLAVHNFKVSPFAFMSRRQNHRGVRPPDSTPDSSGEPGGAAIVASPTDGRTNT